MLDKQEYLYWCKQVGLSSQACEVVTAIRTSPPARRVGGGRHNVTVRYPSRKMGCTIQAESHKNELAGIYEYEYDSDVLEYYDQPPSIKLTYPSKKDRTIGHLHTADYFVVRRTSAGWEEWKTEAELQRLAEKTPHRYQRDEAGNWRCPPGEQVAVPLGLYYRVRSSAEIDWIYQRNLRFLEDYLRADCPPVSSKVKTAVQAAVKSRPGMTLADLLGESWAFSPDSLYILIATGEIYVKLHRGLLVEPQTVAVFADRVTAEAYAAAQSSLYPLALNHDVLLTSGTNLQWDERCWILLNSGLSTVTLMSEAREILELPSQQFEYLLRQGKLKGTPTTSFELHSDAQALLLAANPADLEEANRRYAALYPTSDEQPQAGHVSERTLRSWRAKYRAAEQQWGCGYIGLLPQRQRSGNRTPRLSEGTRALVDDFVTHRYETLKQKGKRQVWGELVVACQEQGLTPPSYKTFIEAVEARPREEQTRKRQGYRAAYGQSPFYWELSLTTPRHGDRPFEIAHLDHTELDIETVHALTGEPLGRPWASFLVDAFSRRLLVVYLSYECPSYRTCMMLLRECVRRWSRLPQTLVVDGGKEFISTYFEALLARYECIKKTRPPAQARFGSVVERLFGTANTTFVHNLLGNTQILRQTRQVTASVSPQRQACWDLPSLYQRFQEWAYELYDTTLHPALGLSPRAAFTAGMLQSGQRPHRLVPYDHDFILATLPTTQRGLAKVRANMGVKLHHLYYWNEALKDPEVETQSVPVRYDPYDAGTAYVYVHGQWLRCVSQYYDIFKGRSEREIQIASTELRRLHQIHAQQFTITAARLASFILSVEAQEVLLTQRQHDDQMRAALASLDGLPSRIDHLQEPTPLEEAKVQFHAPLVSEAHDIYEDY